MEKKKKRGEKNGEEGRERGGGRWIEGKQEIKRGSEGTVCCSHPVLGQSKTGKPVVSNPLVVHLTIIRTLYRESTSTL